LRGQAFQAPGFSLNVAILGQVVQSRPVLVSWFATCSKPWLFSGCPW